MEEKGRLTIVFGPFFMEDEPRYCQERGCDGKYLNTEAHKLWHENNTLWKNRRQL